MGKSRPKTGRRARVGVFAGVILMMCGEETMPGGRYRTAVAIDIDTPERFSAWTHYWQRWPSSTPTRRAAADGIYLDFVRAHYI